MKDTPQRKIWRAKWRRRNRAKLNAAARKWRAEHRDRARATQQRDQRRRYAANQERIRVLKDYPCTDCGVKYPPYVMDFDHVPGRGAKQFPIAATQLGRRWTAVLREIRKCELVCANCHRERTHARLRLPR